MRQHIHICANRTKVFKATNFQQQIHTASKQASNLIPYACFRIVFKVNEECGRSYYVLFILHFLHTKSFLSLNRFLNINSNCGTTLFLSISNVPFG